jgi:type IV secretion system protein VirB4
VGWIEALCELNGMPFTPRHRNAVAEAVMHLRLSPTRTLTELSANVQDIEIRDALQHFTVMGPVRSRIIRNSSTLFANELVCHASECNRYGGTTGLDEVQNLSENWGTYNFRRWL